MTTHYEERMQVDLDTIHRKLRKVSDLVENQVQNAVEALLTGTDDLAKQVVLGDRQVNRRIKQVDYLCHAFIVRHAPSAGHLRQASAALRFGVALERVGDYAGMISREVVQLGQPVPDAVSRDIELIAHQARHTLSEALRAFHESDLEIARQTYGLADQTDLTLDKVMTELVVMGDSRAHSVQSIFSLLRIVSLIKRVAEQSENICEQAIFQMTGETRHARVFRILFVDEHNNRSSQIAEAYARKAFPKSGVYHSAGWNCNGELDENLIDFMDRHGVDMRSAFTRRLRPVADEPEHFHVIVSFSPGIREHLGKLPYRTTLLEWDHGAGSGMDDETLEKLYKNVVVYVQDLMLTLAGPDAC